MRSKAMDIIVYMPDNAGCGSRTPVSFAVRQNTF